MADNTTLNSGSGGDVISTDDIAGVKVQRVKVQFGADGAASDVTSTATNPLPVALSDVDNAVLDTIAAGQLADGHNVVVTDGVDTIAIFGSSASDAEATTSKPLNTASFSYSFNGTTWDRMRGSVADGLLVNLGGNNDVTASGNVAHDAADSGSPVKIGGKAKAFDGTAPGTDVAEDDRVDAIYTVSGIQYVENAHPNHWDVSVDYAAAQTNATVKAAPGAGLKLYITDVIISNGATAGNITLLDGSGGTVKLELYPAINGGMTHSFKNPIALTANTLLAITSTTVTTHSVTVSGFTAA